MLGVLFAFLGDLPTALFEARRESGDFPCAPRLEVRVDMSARPCQAVSSSDIAGAYCSVDETSASTEPAIMSASSAASGAYVAGAVGSGGETFDVDIEDARVTLANDEDPRATSLRWLDAEMDKMQ